MQRLGVIELAGLRLVKYPAPVLAGRAEEVEYSAELRPLAARMFEIMYAAHGVGLAAPQVGLPIRMFVINTHAEPGGEELVAINPRIVATDGQAINEEGCLSVPGLTCRIKRATHVTIQALDVNGQEFTLAGEGLLARAFQHETDHLDGVLVINRMSPVARLGNRRLLKDLEEQFEAKEQGES
jgi:peptide deformylase